MHLCLRGGFLGQVTGFSPRQSSFSSEIVGTLITLQSGGGGHLTAGTGADKRPGFHRERETQRKKQIPVTASVGDTEIKLCAKDGERRKDMNCLGNADLRMVEGPEE